MADVIRLDLDTFDTSVADVQVGTYKDVAVATITFGWLSNRTFSSTNPKLLERIGDLCHEAARSLEAVRDDRSVA